MDRQTYKLRRSVVLAEWQGLTANAGVLGEQHVHYIVELLQTMIDEDLTSVEADEEACRIYNEQVQEALKDTAWCRKGAAHGYYRHADSGRIVITTPRHNSTVWHDTRRPNMGHITAKKREGAGERQRPEIKMLSI